MKMNNLTPAEMVRAVDNDPNATENERALAEALDRQLKEIARITNRWREGSYYGTQGVDYSNG